MNLSKASDFGLISYMRHTYRWMFIGLLMSFVTASLFYMSNIWMSFYTNMPLVFGAFIAEVILVLYFASRINRMSVGAAKTVFIAYAVVNGLTLTPIMAAYEMTSLILVFAMTSVFFATLTIYGFVTKKDLTRWGPMLLAGLVALMVFWILSIFINLQSFEKIACVVGLLIFVGLTAYDTQKIKDMYYSMPGDENLLVKASIFGALQLYLDFINMFLYLLRIFAKEK